MSISRRSFLKFAGSSLAAASALPAVADHHMGAKGHHVVVIGGGFGGAAAAKHIRRLDPSVKVTLIDGSANHVTCPFSNLVLGGVRTMDQITVSFDTLKNKHGVSIVQDWVTGIDATAQTVSIKNGEPIKYDRLVVSPGIDFSFDKIEGLSEELAESKLPHAWKAGPQTDLLRQQLEAMKDGGTVIISVPGNPYRCPPGPYERAGMIAHYLKQNKPKSKVLILDAKDKFAKQGLFIQGWKDVYGDMIEWVSGPNGGTVTAVDADAMTVTAGGKTIKGDVINIIPPQKAGMIAHEAGLTDDSGWCPVNQKTYESTIHKNIHVIGDASIAGPLPKSGYSANSEAKVCAAAVVAMLKGQDVSVPTWVNTCYSFVAPDYGISVAAVYALDENNKTIAVKDAGGVSPAGGNVKAEAAYAESWYKNIVADTWG